MELEVWRIRRIPGLKIMRLIYLAVFMISSSKTVAEDRIRTTIQEECAEKGPFMYFDEVLYDCYSCSRICCSQYMQQADCINHCHAYYDICVGQTYKLNTTINTNVNSYTETDITTWKNRAQEVPCPCDMVITEQYEREGNPSDNRKNSVLVGTSAPRNNVENKHLLVVLIVTSIGGTVLILTCILAKQYTCQHTLSNCHWLMTQTSDDVESKKLDKHTSMSFQNLPHFEVKVPERMSPSSEAVNSSCRIDNASMPTPPQKSVGLIENEDHSPCNIPLTEEHSSQLLEDHEKDESRKSIVLGRDIPESTISSTQRLSMRREPSLSVIVPKNDYEVLDILDILDMCKAYLFEDGKIEVHVDLTEYSYIRVIRELEHKTGRQEMDFRIKEYMSSTFTYMSLIPGELVENVDKPRETKAAIGAFLQCREDGSRYALTVAHAIKEGDVCRAVNKDGYERVIGKCVATINKQSKPMSFDIAIILIDNDFSEEIENAIFNSQRDKCTFRLPESDDETRAMECWKIQRKAHGTWQYGYLRHAVYTNKEHGIYRGITVVRAHETCPMLTEGECGSLVTSLPREGKLTVYGMLMGRLEQEADDGGDPLELYIAFPFRHAIKELQKLIMFRGKTLELLGNNQESEIHENDQMGANYYDLTQRIDHLNNHIPSTVSSTAWPQTVVPVNGALSSLNLTISNPNSPPTKTIQTQCSSD